MVRTTVIQKPANIKDCSTFVSLLDFMSYQHFSKYPISSPILIKIVVTLYDEKKLRKLIEFLLLLKIEGKYDAEIF